MDVEKTQGGQPHYHGIRAELQLREEHRLILADMLRTELVRSTVKVSAEVLNTVDVRANRCGGKVATPQLLKHDLA